LRTGRERGDVPRTTDIEAGFPGNAISCCNLVEYVGYGTGRIGNADARAGPRRPQGAPRRYVRSTRWTFHFRFSSGVSMQQPAQPQWRAGWVD
jgi:hypothetical protein